MTAPFASTALARRVESGWARAQEESAVGYTRANPDAGVAIEEVAGGIAAFMGVGSPLSQCQGPGFEGPVDNAQIDRLVAFFHSRGAAVAVEVATLADPGFLPALSRRGFQVAEQTHVLVRPVTPADANLEMPAGLAVSRLDADPKNKRDWTASVMKGFFEGPGPPPDGMEGVMEMMIASPGASGWLARVGGEAAGGATLLLYEGLALFAGDATVPALRGRGVQLAVIRARLAEAARRGCDLAAACTNPGTISQRNYERAGFRVAYARTLMLLEAPSQKRRGEE